MFNLFNTDNRLKLLLKEKNALIRKKDAHIKEQHDHIEEQKITIDDCLKLIKKQEINIAKCLEITEGHKKQIKELKSLVGVSDE